MEIYKLPATPHNIPLIFHILKEPSFDAVMICSEFGVKHKEVTALCEPTEISTYMKLNKLESE